MNVLARLLSDVLPWLLVAVLVFSLSQRRFMQVGVGKRFATLQLALLVGALWGASIVFEHFEISDVYLIPVAVALAGIGVARRGSIFPHRLRCRQCGARLPAVRIFYYDEPRCASCAAKEQP